MGKDSRKYTDKTLKRLFALSGNECAFPGCNKILVNKMNAKDVNICHIEAANENGERYNPNMSDLERADYLNLILLCIQHHDETNNEVKYTVDILQKMKNDHETEQFNKSMQKNPSMLRNTINAISSLDFGELDEIETLDLFDPKEKISFNDLKTNVTLINEYKNYYHRINKLYDELEFEGSIKKEKLLSNIRLLYTEIKGKYILNNDDYLEIIRDNSDNIFDDIYNTLLTKMKDTSFWVEDIEFGIRLIMVDAFLRCKILEEPKK